ncbi:hypothetical protein TWF694_005514 [Orbilia ellipsospora]|uniref:Nucleoside phosphorylase domain-containing protein n=1 Tax=Orbilia ellipsospora TaxID=2528407 RepID=A0AAV9WTD4_9PEZI
MTARNKNTRRQDDQPYSLGSYTIGWVFSGYFFYRDEDECKFIFNEIHPKLPTNPRDTTKYSFGRIGQHNVVVAHIPNSTNRGAASYAAANMSLTFFNVSLILLVGTAGGVPKQSLKPLEQDVVCGDVVVSYYGKWKECGFVIPYLERGNDKQYQIKDMNYSPSPETIKALENWKDRIAMGRTKITRYLPKAKEINPDWYHPPWPERDILYQVDSDQCVERAIRTSHDPVVHYGAIGAGDTAMTDGYGRDQLRDMYGVLAFDTQTRELLRGFNMVVIKGISHYCDGRPENMNLGPWGSLTATAAAKDFLNFVSVITPGPPQHQLCKWVNESECETSWLEPYRVPALVYCLSWVGPPVTWYHVPVDAEGRDVIRSQCLPFLGGWGLQMQRERSKLSADDILNTYPRVWRLLGRKLFYEG